MLNYIRNDIPWTFKLIIHARRIWYYQFFIKISIIKGELYKISSNLPDSIDKNIYYKGIFKNGEPLFGHLLFYNSESEF